MQVDRIEEFLSFRLQRQIALFELLLSNRPLPRSAESEAYL